MRQAVNISCLVHVTERCLCCLAELWVVFDVRNSIPTKTWTWMKGRSSFQDAFIDIPWANGFPLRQESLWSSRLVSPFGYPWGGFGSFPKFQWGGDQKGIPSKGLEVTWLEDFRSTFQSFTGEDVMAGILSRRLLAIEEFSDIVAHAICWSMLVCFLEGYAWCLD